MTRVADIAALLTDVMAIAGAARPIEFALLLADILAIALEFAGRLRLGGHRQDSCGHKRRNKQFTHGSSPFVVGGSLK
jgi:hypothetical protein